MRDNSALFPEKIGPFQREAIGPAEHNFVLYRSGEGKLRFREGWGEAYSPNGSLGAVTATDLRRGKTQVRELLTRDWVLQPGRRVIYNPRLEGKT